MRLLSKASLIVAGVHAAAMIAVPARAQDTSTDAPGTQGTPPPVRLQPGPATPTASQDVIYLKGGGLLRGTLIDAIPGSQARIQLATGEIATVPWEQIDKIAQADQQPPAPPAPPAPPPVPKTPKAPPAPAPPQATGSVTVHVDGADGAQLQMGATGHDDWKTVCELPCEATVPAGAYYRVISEDMRPSPDFQLQAGAGGHEAIHVKAASKGSSTLGAVLAGGGGIAAYIGLLVGMTGSAAASSDRAFGSDPSGDQRTATTGWVTCAAGLGLVVGGLIMVMSNTKTTVAQDVDTRSTGLLRDDAFKRMPTWREASPLDRGAPSILGVPILSGSF